MTTQHITSNLSLFNFCGHQAVFTRRLVRVYTVLYSAQPYSVDKVTLTDGVLDSEAVDICDSVLYFS